MTICRDYLSCAGFEVCRSIVVNVVGSIICITETPRRDWDFSYSAKGKPVGTIIYTTTATAEDICKIIEKLVPQLVGVNTSHAIMSLLSLSIILMHPEATAKEIQEAIKELSGYMCMLIDGMDSIHDPEDGDDNPKRPLN